MAVTTKDRAKVGQTTYRASGSVWDGDEHHDVPGCDGEYKTLPAAKLAARSWLRKGAEWFCITRGTWEAQDISDEEYGVVRHAHWDQDETWIVNGCPDGQGGIDWTEESW